MPSIYRFLIALCLAVCLASAVHVSAQQIVYDDALENGWVSYGWANLNFSNTSPVYSGSDSISVTSTGTYQALYLHHSEFDSTIYSALTFWINGGASGGQSINVQATLNGNAQAAVSIGTLAPNTWKQVTIPLSSLGVADQSDMDGFWIQTENSSTPAEFYVDAIQLTAATIPSPIDIAVNGATPLEPVDTRLLGLNTAIWDSSVDSAPTRSLIAAAGFTILRWPGGSSSDTFNWSTNLTVGDSYVWAGNTGSFVNLAISANANAVITINYGSGTPQMAAAWVAYLNGSPSSTQVIGVDSKGTNWNTVGYWASLRAASPLAIDDGYNFLRIAHPASVAFEHYEIGNEVYGTWEYDTHGTAGSGLSGLPNDPYTYAQCAVQYIQAMKAVDPAVKIGCVAVPGEDSYNGGPHSVPNPNEGNSLHSGWTPVMLYTLHSLGYVPDFIIDHRYPEAPGSESDSGLLSDSSAWSADATDLRSQITNYVGATGSEIELDATEANSVYTNPGKQTVSLVNALYAEDSLGVLSQTEFKDLNWWDMRNGYSSGNNNSSSLYGWRDYGDYGLISSPGDPDAANTPYPPYYAFKLASHWITPGSTSLTTTSAFPLLTAYGTAQADGSLMVLVINKSSTLALNGSIAVTGYNLGSTATVYSYGETNDTNNADLTTSSLQSVTSPLGYTFPAYSMTLFHFLVVPSVPNAPTGLAATGGSGQVVLSWTATSGATSYNLYRSTSSGGEGTSAYKTILSGTSYTDTSVTDGVVYYYKLAAVGSGGISAQSAEVSATPQVPGPTITSLSPASATAGGAAFTLTLTGTGFVTGAVVDWNGSALATTYSSSSKLTAAVTAAEIALAGSIAVTVTDPASGGPSNSVSYNVNNPAPTLYSVSPSTVTAGTAGFTLTLSGKNFVSTSLVNWNGIAEATTFVSATKLTASIPASLITTRQSAAVTAFNPTPGGGTSTASAVNVVLPAISSLASSKRSLAGSTSATGTVTLNAAALAGGETVTLTSSSPAAASVPATITVPAGSSTATFPITTYPVSENVSVTIEGAAGGATHPAYVTVTAPVISSIAFSPTSVLGGLSSTGTLTIGSPAPAGGTVVTLSSSDTTAASVPSSATVAAGATTQTFTLTTTPVSATASATISAVANGITRTTLFKVAAPVVTSLVLSSSSVNGGSGLTATVTISGPAPTGGIAVTLASSVTAASVPATVTVPAGALTATFDVTSIPVSTNTTAKITAQIGSSTTISANLTIDAPVLQSIAAAPNPVTGGLTITVTVTLTGPAPASGTTVTLKSSSSTAPVPVSVVVSANSTSASAIVTTVAVASSTSVTLTGTEGVAKTTSLSILP